MNIIVVGGGRKLYFLCQTFRKERHRVVVINRDLAECENLAESLDVTVIHGDASETHILDDAGAKGADIILAMTPNDEDNLVICQVAALRFKVPRTMAIVKDPNNEEVFTKLGIEAFSTTATIASLIEERTVFNHIRNLIPVGGGGIHITEVGLSDRSPANGKTLQELGLPSDSLVAVVTRNGTPLVPRGNTRLQSGDQVVLVTLPGTHVAALKLVTGNGK